MFQNKGWWMYFELAVGAQKWWWVALWRAMRVVVDGVNDNPMLCAQREKGAQPLITPFDEIHVHTYAHIVRYGCSSTDGAHNQQFERLGVCCGIFCFGLGTVARTNCVGGKQFMLRANHTSEW